MLVKKSTAAFLPVTPPDGPPPPECSREKFCYKKKKKIQNVLYHLNIKVNYQKKKSSKL
jgi:hypothetical protein